MTSTLDAFQNAETTSDLDPELCDRMAEAQDTLVNLLEHLEQRLTRETGKQVSFIESDIEKRKRAPGCAH